jgi:hypothetical protein
MLRTLIALGALAFLSGAAVAADLKMAPPPAPYEKASKAVKLPDFVPGLGALYVDPKTLPYGPWLAYDHDNKLVSTIYMIPLNDMTSQKKIEDLRPVARLSMSSSITTPATPVCRCRTTMSFCGTSRTAISSWPSRQCRGARCYLAEDDCLFARLSSSHNPDCFLDPVQLTADRQLMSVRAKSHGAILQGLEVPLKGRTSVDPPSGHAGDESRTACRVCIRSVASGRSPIVPKPTPSLRRAEVLAHFCWARALASRQGAGWSCEVSARPRHSG